jgi:putative membrane protein
MRETMNELDRRTRHIHPVDAGRTFFNYCALGLKGFCMGVADIIPGISGGTIAFILEIYEDLIKAVRSFDIRFLKLIVRGRFREALGSVAWRFLGTVMIGIGCAILLLSRVITWLLAEHPVLINAFFFGLILATIPIIAKAIKKWDAKKISALVLAAAGTFFFVQLTPGQTPEAAWFVFASGALAICAMILPGISGAFILLLLGKYEFILGAIHSRDIVTILIFISGMAVGILSFVRVLGWLFKRYHDMTIAVLAGFVIGSLNKIWPWKNVLETMTTSSGKIITLRETNSLPPAIDGAFLLAVLIMAAGCLVAFLLHAVPQKRSKQTSGE